MSPATSDDLVGPPFAAAPEPILRVVLAPEVDRTALGARIQEAAKRAGVPCICAVNRPQLGDAWLMGNTAHAGEIARAGATLFGVSKAEQLLAQLAAQESGLVEAEGSPDGGTLPP